MLSQHLGCPVLVDNDVNIMALGEMHAGLARTVDDFLFVKIGTGVGCGIVVDGQVYRGVSGSAGDIGHIRVDDDGPVCACGNVGCLEALLQRRRARPRRAARPPAPVAPTSSPTGSREAGDARPPPTSPTAAAAGDPVAVEMVRDGGRRLGLLLAGLVSFFNPGMVVIGGEVAAGLGHPLLAEIRSVVYRRSLPARHRQPADRPVRARRAGRRRRRDPHDLRLRLLPRRAMTRPPTRASRC